MEEEGDEENHCKEKKIGKKKRRQSFWLWEELKMDLFCGIQCV